MASQKYDTSFDVQLNKLQNLHLKDDKIDEDDVSDFENHVNRITKYFQKSKPQQHVDESQTNLEAQEILAENLLTSVVDVSTAQDEENLSNFASPEKMPEEMREHDVGNKDSLSVTVNVEDTLQCLEAPFPGSKDPPVANREGIIFSCIACSVIHDCSPPLKWH